MNKLPQMVNRNLNIWLKLQTLRERHYPGICQTINLIAWILKTREAFPAVVREIQREVIIEAGSNKRNITGFEDGKRELGVNHYKWALETRKAQETFTSRVYRKECSPAITFTLANWDPYQTYEIINLF